MINSNDVKFGRLAPKDRWFEGFYSFTKRVSMTTKTVERVLPLPGLRTFYDQKGKSACVGYSTEWMMSIYNWGQKYDAEWLYHRAQANDKDPYTTPEQDNGSYVWAAFWSLMHLGNQKLTENSPDMNDGILSYYWGRGADNARTAIALGRPVVVGTNWYESFFTPDYINSEWWIGRTPNLGPLTKGGGHAYCIYGASDKRQAVKSVGTWGMVYPLVWIPYEIVDRLIREDGEMTVAIDNIKVT